MRFGNQNSVTIICFSQACTFGEYLVLLKKKSRNPSRYINPTGFGVYISHLQGGKVSKLNNLDNGLQRIVH